MNRFWGFVIFMCFLTLNEVLARDVQHPLQYTILSTKYAASTPFWIKIGGEKYYFVRDREDGSYSYRDLVGCDKSKKQLFEAFYELNTDNDIKLTSEELNSARIRLVHKKLNDKLAFNDNSEDYPIEKVAYIDLGITSTSYDRWLRPFGVFTMYVYNERGRLKKYLGHAGYEHPKVLQRMFD